MLTKNELERRGYLASLDVNGSLFATGKPARSDDSERSARRLRRQRRESVDAYRRPTGWSVGLW